MLRKFYYIIVKIQDYHEILNLHSNLRKYQTKINHLDRNVKIQPRDVHISDFKVALQSEIC